MISVGLLLLIIGLEFPFLPFYQRNLPWLMALGGFALVSIYLAVGFLSVAAYGLLSSLWSLFMERDSLKVNWLFGVGSFLAAGMFFLLYYLCVLLSQPL